MAITQTSRFGLTQWSSGDDAVGRAYFLSDNLSVENLGAIFQSGLTADRPAASDDIANRSFWYSTDDGVLYFSDGSNWNTINDLALSSDPYTVVAGTVSNSEGASTRLARADHKHPVSTASATTVTGSNSAGSAVSLARSDHNHALGSGVVGTAQLAATAVTRTKLNTDIVSATGSLTYSTANGLSINTGATVSISANTLIVTVNSIDETHLKTSVAGDGLSGGNGSALAVNTDGSTLEIDSDSLRIKDLGVTTAKINDAAVTTAKINDSAVTTSKINNLAVTAGKIGADAVTAEKINLDVAGSGLGQDTDGSLKVNVDGSTLEINSDSLRIKDLGVTTGKINTDAVTAAKINLDVAGDGLGQATSGALKVNVDGSTLEINSDSLQIKDSGVTTAKIDDDAVTAAKIDSGVAGSGLGQATSGALQVNVDGSTLEINSDTLRVKADGITRDHINSNIAGDGLQVDGNGALYVGTDNSTIEKSGDALRVKASGINSGHVNSTVFVRGTYDFSPTSAKIYIDTDGPSGGSSGDIWFQY